MPNVVDIGSVAGEAFDLVIVGSGFGSSFYLQRMLARNASSRILVLEWGGHRTHDWQIAQGRHSDTPDADTYVSDSDKPWKFTIGLGGGTNCWFAQTPRFHPSDFALRSRYGVGSDWPLRYEDLEQYYVDAETIMSVSGDPQMAAMFPRSAPFPQPPHRFTAPDRLLAEAQPGQHFAMPTARARVATKDRPACCASFRCTLCPVDAKFTLNNGLIDIYSHPGVTVVLNAQVVRFETSGNNVHSAVVEYAGRDWKVKGDRFVLGANAIHSPAILHRSDMGGGYTGLGLHESYGCHVEVLLDGLDNFDGSTITTGLNFGLYDGEHRSEMGGAIVYTENRWLHGLRAIPGRMRQSLPIMVVVEELVEDRNAVTVGQDGRAVVSYAGPSDYAVRGQRRALDKLPKLLEPLPVERIIFRSQRPTESHLQGTLRMGRDPRTSVVDGAQVHHRWRNLTVVGSSVFSTCSAMNPSLTVAALSLRAADLA
ncbi:GMC family oxidoreductase [Sphingomonas panaciterrae]|uniref:GMC family oxidoreductase n=1 Tax=Sphingomonas panaciterrae TaxID=1462999 RepID=UPI002FEEDF93